jgi:nitrate reductase molybdenum cofactor assembly chaperone NarJ/NarW
MNVLSLASIALSYPDQEILDVREEFVHVVKGLPDSASRTWLRRFARWWAIEPPSDLAHHYVEVFDMSRRTALDLTYLTYGDRRQRGLALLTLKERYRDAGFELATSELPDHLPVILEYAARAGADGVALLTEFRPQLEVLRLALIRAETPYAGVAEAVCVWMPELTADEAAKVRRLIAEGPPVEQVGLEPFAPPEVMPDSRRPLAPCGSAGPTLTPEAHR